MLRLCSSLLSLLIASSASALTMDWTFVGNPGNAADGTGFGAVGYAYNIGTYEITNAQYAEFLNAKAASDPLALYNTSMGSGFGGITRSGASGSFSYGAIAGRADMPVNYVSYYDALRFANWMHNGQGSGATETGAYTLLGGSQIPSNGTTVTRNPGATIFLTSANEWYKAAYYNAITTSYFDYPAGSDTQTTCTAPTAAPNSANCDDPSGSDATDADIDNLTIRGLFTGSASPYGTFDQGGNVLEWNEQTGGASPGISGGSFQNGPSTLAASFHSVTSGVNQNERIGFRITALAGVPEPGTGLLVIAGLLGLAGWRRVRA